MSDASPLQALPSDHSWQNIECKDNSQVHNGHVYGDVYHNDVQNVYQNQKSPAERLLESLEFPGMYRYQERPLQSYEGTYEWFFDGNVPVHCKRCVGALQHGSNCPDRFDCRYKLGWRCCEALSYRHTLLEYASRFRSWLRTSQQEIFWVSGKAGAGKSCLMKFLLESEYTATLLREWAGQEASLNIVGFFFWAAGGDLEKSHNGLLRSLLHQILRQQPDLVGNLLLSNTNFSGLGHGQPWTIGRLQEAFSKVLEESAASRNFMFFIDGLDEFQGDISDLLEALDALNKSPNIKLCVSSRPHNVFQKAYGSREHHLRLHELNRFDIEAYVQGRLESDFDVHRKTETGTETDSQLHTISAAIQDKAQGVFLWVDFAIKSLRRSLADYWSIPEMLSLLDDTPPDIEDVLQRMFEGIHTVHRQHAARVFLLLKSMHFMRLPVLPLVWLAILIHNERGTTSDDDHPVSPSKLLEMAETAEQAARRWCKDLIDVVRRDGPEYEDTYYRSYRSFIQFPHRTVMDFISTKEADGTLAKFAGDDFCTGFAICSIIAQFVRYIHPIVHYLNMYAMSFVHSSEYVHESKRVAIVDLAKSLNAFGQKLRQDLPHWALRDRRTKQLYGPNFIDLPYPLDDGTCSAVFMAFVVYEGGHRLFWHLYESTPYTITTHSRQVWLHALLVSYKDEAGKAQSLSKMLQLGADLSKPLYPKHGAVSVWQAYLYRCHETDHSMAEHEFLDIMLSYGADPDIELDTSKLYRFLQSSEHSESEDPEFQGPAIEVKYIPATAAFELPLPTATYYYDDDRQRVEKFFPVIKAKLVAASEAKAQRQKQQRQHHSILELMWT